MKEKKPIHILDYGFSGAGKSTFMATMIRACLPGIVLLFDPWDKAKPYENLGVIAAQVRDEQGFLMSESICGANGEFICQIEAMHEHDIDQPTIVERWNRRLTSLQQELNNPYKTVVVDSGTLMDEAFRNYHGIKNYKGDFWRGRGGSASEIERFLMMRTPGWPINFGMVMHTDSDKEKDSSEILRFKPRAPGRTLPDDIPAVFGEWYHAYTLDLPNGTRLYLLQTRSRGIYGASTQIGAPDPCLAEYEAIWGDIPAILPSVDTTESTKTKEKK